MSQPFLAFTFVKLLAQSMNGSGQKSMIPGVLETFKRSFENGFGVSR
jgi:hypothetical protein